MRLVRRSVWRAFLGAATLACLEASAQTPPIQDVLKDLRAIESASYRGDADRLRIAYQEQQKSRPGDPMLKVYLAWFSMPSDQSWNALKAITAFHADNPWAHLGMARIYTHWKKMRGPAQTELDEILKKTPGFYPALVGEGDLLRAEGDWAKAAARYREALALSNDAEAHAGLGLALASAGDAAAAKPELERALALWPDQPEALRALARVARDSRDLAATARSLNLLSALVPRDAAVLKELAGVEKSLGHLAAAAAAYERYAKVASVDAASLRDLAFLYRELKQPESESRALHQLMALEPDEASHAIRLAELADEQGAPEEAETLLAQAVEREPKRGEVWLKLARVRAQRDEPREALQAYRAAAAAGERSGDGEAAELQKRFQLPPKPARGSINQISQSVQGNLNAFFRERLKSRPGLSGTLKLRVRVDPAGRVLAVEVLEDTVGDGLLAGHAFFSLADAVFPPTRREPVFQFDLKPPKGK